MNNEERTMKNEQARTALRICVVGSVNIDLTFRAPRLPCRGETLAADGLQIGFGGKGANQAVMAARLGAHVDLIAKVGNDAFGQEAIANLRKHGVRSDHVGIASDHATGTAAIIVDAEAQNCILIAAGANQLLSEADVAEAAQTIADADIVLGQLEVPLATTLAAFRIARAAGMRTMLNPAPAQALPAELLALSDMVVPNESELATLTGQPGATLDDIALSCRDLLKNGPSHVVVTLGANGALLVGRDQQVHVPGLGVKAVDTTGAGDAFIGSLAVYWARGFSLPEALTKACAVAALSVTRRGTQTSYPSRVEIEDFLTREKRC